MTLVKLILLCPDGKQGHFPHTHCTGAYEKTD